MQTGSCEVTGLKRRSFFGIVAGLFAGGATTTLSAAPLDAVTTITVSDVPIALDPNTPFVILTEELSLKEFEARYLAPYFEAIHKAADRELARHYNEHKFLQGDRW